MVNYKRGGIMLNSDIKNFEDTSVIKLDKNCRIVIPAKVRNAMKIKDGSSVKLVYKNGELTITPDKKVCSICFSEKEVQRVDNDIFICKNCN